MSDQFIAQQLSNGLSISRINSAQSGQVKQSLKDISASSANMGISDGEILCALADGRDKFDPFGIFCTVYGTLMRFMGSTIVLVLALIGLVLVARWIATAVANFGEWLRSAAGGIPLIGPVLKLAGIAKTSRLNTTRSWNSCRAPPSRVSSAASFQP
jgi:phage-related minor tail protein